MSTASIDVAVASITEGPPTKQHAIVIGGRTDGLRRASELAQRFRRVTIVERDRVVPDIGGPGDPSAAYLREHGLPIEQVRLIEGCEVTGVLSDDTTEQVTGVQIRLRPGPFVGTAADPWRELHADQVIDTRR